MSKNDAVIQSQVGSLRGLENEVGQIANVLNARPQGVLPSDTENDREKGNEQCQVIALKSGV